MDKNIVPNTLLYSGVTRQGNEPSMWLCSVQMGADFSLNNSGLQGLGEALTHLVLSTAAPCFFL